MIPSMLPRLIDLVMWKNWLIIKKFLNELHETWQSRTKEWWHGKGPCQMVRARFEKTLFLILTDILFPGIDKAVARHPACGSRFARIGGDGLHGLDLPDQFFHIYLGLLT